MGITGWTCRTFVLPPTPIKTHQWQWWDPSHTLFAGVICVCDGSCLLYGPACASSSALLFVGLDHRQRKELRTLRVSLTPGRTLHSLTQMQVKRHPTASVQHIFQHMWNTQLSDGSHDVRKHQQLNKFIFYGSNESQLWKTDCVCLRSFEAKHEQIRRTIASDGRTFLWPKMNQESFRFGRHKRTKKNRTNWANTMSLLGNTRTYFFGESKFPARSPRAASSLWFLVWIQSWIFGTLVGLQTVSSREPLGLLGWATFNSSELLFGPHKN